jgi:predicted Zn-dependent protease
VCHSAERIHSFTVPDYQRSLLAAQGYAELEMFDDALAALGKLPAEAAADPTVIELRIVILTQAHRWPEALEQSEALRRLKPDAPAGFIHVAFCLHGLGRSAEAKEILLRGPAALTEVPTFHYNLACYECALGNFDEARRYLERSFQMDRKFREFAKTDPDLVGLRL